MKIGKGGIVNGNNITPYNKISDAPDYKKRGMITIIVVFEEKKLEEVEVRKGTTLSQVRKSNQLILGYPEDSVVFINGEIVEVMEDTIIVQDGDLIEFSKASID